MELEIVELAGGGRGVARAGRKVFFVGGALPGERVEIEVERERAGVVEARAVRIVTASPAREPDPCPVAGACGGCDLAHLRREAAADALRRVVLGALRHAPRQVAEALEEAPVVPSPMGWRLRARLHWDPTTATLGFLGPRSHRAVDIAPCRVVSPLLLSSRPAMAAALAAAGAPAGQVEWLETLDATVAVAGWWGDGVPPAGEITGLAGWHKLGRDGALPRAGRGAEGVTMALPVPLWVPIGAFFQANRFLVPRLFERIAELSRAAGHGRVVDLFGGVGYLAAAARHGGATAVTVVEPHRGAARSARRNLPDACVLAVSAEVFLRRPGSGVGTLAIVDPPRVGLSSQARAGIADWRPEAIAFMSCDPARFGRDATAFLSAGYRIESVEIWDLFAGSHHAEILAILRR